MNYINVREETYDYFNDWKDTVNILKAILKKTGPVELTQKDILGVDLWSAVAIEQTEDGRVYSYEEG